MSLLLLRIDRLVDADPKRRSIGELRRQLRSTTRDNRLVALARIRKQIHMTGVRDSYFALAHRSLSIRTRHVDGRRRSSSANSSTRSRTVSGRWQGNSVSPRKRTSEWHHPLCCLNTCSSTTRPEWLLSFWRNWIWVISGLLRPWHRARTSATVARSDGFRESSTKPKGGLTRRCS